MSALENISIESRLLDVLGGPGQQRCEATFHVGKDPSPRWWCTRPAGHTGPHVATIHDSFPGPDVRLEGSFCHSWEGEDS